MAPASPKSFAGQSMSRGKLQSGLSLVELMVALVIALVLSAGVIQIFLGSNQTYRFQEELSRIQENSRFARDELSRSIRTAGYMGCPSPRTELEVNNIVSGTLDGFHSAATPDPDSPYYGTLRFVEGLDNVSSTTIGGLSVVDGTDVLILRGGVLPEVRLVTNKPPSTEAVTDGKSEGWGAGDILLISECSDGLTPSVNIFEVTAVSTVGAGEAFEHSTSANDTDELSRAYGMPPATAELLRYQTQRFFLANRNANSTAPTLWRTLDNNTTEALVEGVEDMQLLFGVEGTNPGSVATYADASSVAADDWGRVLSVRISLLLVGDRDNMLDAAQSLTFNGTEVNPGDRRIRQVVTLTTALRNRTP